jgi:hypothetical protein
MSTLGLIESTWNALLDTLLQNFGSAYAESSVSL